MKQELKSIKNEVDSFLYEYQEMIIRNLQDYEKAGDIYKQIANKIKDVEDQRKKYTKPLDDAKKAIMEDVKKIKEPLEEFQKTIKKEMTEFWKEEQKRRDEEQKRIEAEALQKAKEEKKSEAEVPIVNEEKTTRGDYSSVTAKKVWTWELINENEVPDEYKVVDHKKINEAVRNGVRDIPGVRIHQEDQITVK